MDGTSRAPLNQKAVQIERVRKISSRSHSSIAMSYVTIAPFACTPMDVMQRCGGASIVRMSHSVLSWERSWVKGNSNFTDAVYSIRC